MLGVEDRHVRKTYRCPAVVIHFARDEDAAKFIATLPPEIRHDARLMKGGEVIPVCKVEV